MAVSNTSVAALQHFERGELRKCLAALGRCAEGDNLNDWHGRLDELRWALVGLRDEGHAEEALAGLETAHALWPEEPGFALEILVLFQNRAYGVPERFLAFREALSPQLATWPSIELLLGLRAAQDGDLAAGQRAFDALVADPDERLMVFPQQGADLAMLTVLHPSSLADKDTSGGLPLMRVKTALRFYFLAQDRRGALEDEVTAVAFFNKFNLPHPLFQALETMEDVAPLLSFEGKSALLMLLNAAGHDRKARALVDAMIDSDEGRRSLRFTKAACVCAMRMGDAALERRLLLRFESPRHALDSRDRARRLELEKRAQAISVDRTLQVYVGFFGQARAPEQVLPGTAARVSQDFETSGLGRFNLRYGISTWKKSGSRPLSILDRAVFYQEMAPAPLAPLLSIQFGNSAEGLAQTFPNLIREMIRYSCDRGEQEVEAGQLRLILPSLFGIAIDDEMHVERDIALAVEQGGADPGLLPINQFKMWSRIRALKTGLEEAEARSGIRMDAVVVMRGDLQYTHGRLPELAVQAASPEHAKTVFCDHDPHAEYIEGAGDRCMVMSRDGAMALFGVYDILMGALASKDADRDALGHVAPHQALHAILFSLGYTPTPTLTAAAILQRPIIPFDVLKPALLVDAEQASPDVKARIMDVLDKAAILAQPASS